MHADAGTALCLTSSATTTTAMPKTPAVLRLCQVYEYTFLAQGKPVFNVE